MFYGILLVCQSLNPTTCQFVNSSTYFETEEMCMMSAANAVVHPPPEHYIAGVACMEVQFADPDA